MLDHDDVLRDSGAFRYDEAVLARFPGTRAGIVQTSGLVNQPSPPALREAYLAEQRVAAKRLATTAIADHPPVAAWRRVFSGFGAKPTQHRNAAEALLRRLDKHGDIPSINTLVDIGNLVSIRYAMPVAVIDLAGITGTITVRFATGTESFTDLGASGSVHPEPGEVVFVDDDGVVAARRWCWRQSVQSATSDRTVAALIVVEGQHESAGTEVAAAVADLSTLLATHQLDSRAESHLLGAGARA